MGSSLFLVIDKNTNKAIIMLTGYEIALKRIDTGVGKTTGMTRALEPLNKRAVDSILFV